MKNCASSGHVVGGSREGYFGGDDKADPAKGLREYEASVSAKMKEDMIRRLARALSRAGIKVDPDADLDTIVREFADQIPNPKKGKTFSTDAQKQDKVCRTVADVLNDEFSPGATKASDKFIDDTLSAVEVCRQVGDWAHSFASGVNTEFLAVHASVRNLLKKIQVLDDVMERANREILKKADASKDQDMLREIEGSREVFGRAQAERRRLEEVLKNILHVQLPPVAQALELALRDESEQNALIKRLGLKPGTSEFANALAATLSGLGTSAAIAQRVHKALKQVGATVRQYLDSPEYAAFEHDHDMVEKGVKPAEIAEYIRAMTVIRDSFGSRQEPRFREALEEVSRAEGGRGRHHGGAEDDENSSTLAKRLKREQTEKGLINREFAGRMARHYEEFLAAVKAMGPKLGGEIPLSDKTDALRDALARVSDMRDGEKRLELALIGWYVDADARERKERFVNALRVVEGACEAVMELEMYRATSAYFARLKAAISGIEKTIDYYAEIVTKKFGGEGGNPDTLGGAAEDELALPEIARSGLSLREAVSEFAYFYYVAGIRQNFGRTAEELDSYRKDYKDLLGDAVAARLYQLEKEKQDRLAALTPSAALYGRLGRNGPWLPAATGSTSTEKASLDCIKTWVEEEYKTKIEFYKVVQAVDLYLQVFTEAIVKDPDAVKDIKKILNGTEDIARWFNEETGEHLWKAFEHMGSIDNGHYAPNVVGVTATKNGSADHYFKKVSEAITAKGGATTVGVPEIGVAPEAAQAAKKEVERALDLFQALKNLVNSFARIGDKFGGREIRMQVFMSPAQMYKALFGYLKHSAMSVNTLPAAGGQPAALSMPYAVGTTPRTTVADAVPPYYAYFGSVYPSLRGNYAVEDRYFAMIIKSMAAKILTTLGVYEMFEKSAPRSELTPTRMIVGGGEADPEILDGAAELYFRLPRLAEFYRSFLRWDGVPDARTLNDTLRIAMLPELEGVFAGFIRMIFQKAVAPETGDYSESEMREMIEEINSIYEHFKAKKGEKATKAALDAFVVEINRRYGIVKADDMASYMKSLKAYRAQGDWVGNDTNYAILPGEDANETEGMAPSSRFGLTSATPASQYAPYTGRTQLDLDGKGAQMLLRNFRTLIDEQFESARGVFGTVSYSLLIQQAEAEMRRAQLRDEKRKVAFRLIQATSVVSVDANKALMFHETVVVGLNLLSAIESMLWSFNKRIDKMNPVAIEGAVMDALYLFSKGSQLNASGEASVLARPGGLAGSLGSGAALARLVAERMGTTSYEEYIYGPTNYAGRSGMKVGVSFQALVAFIANEEGSFHDNGSAGLGAQLADKYSRPSAYAQTPELTTADGKTVEAANRSTNPFAVEIAVEATKRFVRSLQVFARASVNYGQIMQNFVENLFGLVSDSQGLVELHYTAGAQPGIQLGFTKLRELVENTLKEVKFYFDQFRPYLTKEAIDKFEGRMNPGSVFWLEEHLMDRYIRGDSDDNTKSLDGLSRKTSAVLQALVREMPSQFDRLTPGALGAITAEDRAGIIAPPEPKNPSRCEWYGQAFCGMVFYNATEADQQTGAADASSNTKMNAVGSTDLTTGYSILGNLIKEKRDGASPKTAIGAAAVGRYPVFSTSDPANPLTKHRSLLFAFNQLVAWYLSTLTDTAGGSRVYRTLIDSTANGSLSRAVSNPAENTFPDLAAGGTEFGLRADPRPDAVLCQSLAWILQRLAKDVNPNNQLPDHIASTLADTPLYMKETFRANLPSFIRLFDLLCQKGEFIKQLLQKTSIRVDRPDQKGVVFRAKGAPYVQGERVILAGTGYNARDDNAAFPRGALAGLSEFTGALDSGDMRAILTAIIDGLANGAYTLSNAAAEVLKELSDRPEFFQTQEGSIETYKRRYGKMPLMPISLALYFLKNVPHRAGQGYEDTSVFPMHTSGSPEFRVLYGHRQLLARTTPVSYEQTPGVKAILDAYNSVSSKREQLDEGRYLKYLQMLVEGLRYIVGSRNYKSALADTSRLFSARSLIQDTGVVNVKGPGIVLKAGKANTAAFAIDKTATDIVSVVENTNQADEIRSMTAIVGTTVVEAANDRKTECIYNLIDMNVIPINFHAMQREIPLANLYNYEFTFEQMAASMYGEQTKMFTMSPGLSDTETKSTRQMLLRMLVDPYTQIDALRYGSDSRPEGSTGYVHRIFRGDNNLGMGRPKFLSDQVFNKALFGSIYRGAFDEAGPTEGIGMIRGVEAASIAGIAWPLTYIKATNEPQKMETVERVTLPAGVKTVLEAAGKARFDTTLVRNLFFIVNIVRLVRLRLNRELTQSRNVIVASHPALAANLTEYGADPFTTNETFGENYPNRQTRFNDMDGDTL